jgi:hypothetical protein
MERKDGKVLTSKASRGLVVNTVSVFIGESTPQLV